MVATAPRTAARGVRVVTLRRRHLRQVLAIERLVYPRPWSPAVFASEITQPRGRRYLVALGPRPSLFRPPPVLGYAGLLLQVDEAHVTTVAVHPSWHRRKVASHLLVGLLREARAMGALAATLEVRAANHGAQRLYSAFGFVPAGIRPGYYQETGEDAVIMWLHDLQGAEARTRLALQEHRLREPGGSSGIPDYPVPWVKGRTGLDTPSGGWLEDQA